MYDKFYLSNNKINIIKSFKSNELLIINGDPGSGKKTLAKEILNNCSIEIIDSTFLKSNIDINDYLLNIVSKKNILKLMFKNDINRGIIIENIDIFKKNDKKSYQSIIKFIENKRYYGSKIIITSSNKFINNRSLKKIDFLQLNIEYDRHHLLKIVDTICKEKDIKFTTTEKLDLLKHSNHNLSKINILIDEKYNHAENITDIKSFTDDYYCKNLETNLFIIDTLDPNMIINHYNNDRYSISLNLLYNIYSITKDMNTIFKIYEYFICGDYLEFKNIYFNDYYTILTIYYFYLQIQENKIKLIDLKNNNYISYSLILTYNQNLCNSYNYDNDITYIYLYIYNIYNIVPIFIKEYFKNKNDKYIIFYIKSFNYFYNTKINLNKFNKFINK
jgi:hypothetical protein